MKSNQYKQVNVNNKERVTLQTLIVKELKLNKDYEKFGIEPCFKTEELKKLYEKIAGYEYEEEVK